MLDVNDANIKEWRRIGPPPVQNQLHGHRFDCEQTCYFLAARAFRLAGSKWLQGKRECVRASAIESPLVRLFASTSVYQVPLEAASTLVAWWFGERSVELVYRIPSAEEVLAWQAEGIRCVSLLDDGVIPHTHGHGMNFAIHDLCHLEKFYDPLFHAEQVGFFSLVYQATRRSEWENFSSTFDHLWLQERNHVIADMNGSAIFLLAALKMKLKMAVRRWCAQTEGQVAPSKGPLSPLEENAYIFWEEKLWRALGFPKDIVDAAEKISARRDCAEAANVLSVWFQERGARILRERNPR